MLAKYLDGDLAQKLPSRTQCMMTCWEHLMVPKLLDRDLAQRTARPNAMNDLIWWAHSIVRRCPIAIWLQRDRTLCKARWSWWWLENVMLRPNDVLHNNVWDRYVFFIMKHIVLHHNGSAHEMIDNIMQGYYCVLETNEVRPQCLYSTFRNATRPQNGPAQQILGCMTKGYYDVL